MGWKSIATCLVLASACMPAASQVHRCKDTSGKTIYSDTPCGNGQLGAMIERQKSAREILDERNLAAEANERKFRERALDQQMQSQQAAVQAVAPAQKKQDKSSSYECRQAQREHETVSSIRTGTDEERRNRINAATQKSNAACDLQTEMIQPPAEKRTLPARLITNCNAGFCYGNQGGVGHR